MNSSIGPYHARLASISITACLSPSCLHIICAYANLFRLRLPFIAHSRSAINPNPGQVLGRGVVAFPIASVEIRMSSIWQTWLETQASSATEQIKVLWLCVLQYPLVVVSTAVVVLLSMFLWKCLRRPKKKSEFLSACVCAMKYSY